MKAVYFVLAMLMTSMAYAQSKTTVLISIGDMGVKINKEWSKELCETMHIAMNSEKPVNTQCLHLSAQSMTDDRIRFARNSGQFKYHVQIMRAQSNNISAQVSNWAPEDATDFQNTSMVFSKADLDANLAASVKYVKNLITFDKNRYLYKAHMVMSGIQESKEISVNKEGEFIHNLTQEKISPEQAYTIYSQESERQKNYLRTGLELGAMLGFGLYKYYDNIASNKLDHDYQGFWNSVKLKIKGDAVRTDDNNTSANVGHVLAGVSYYAVARSNGFSVLESSLWTIGSSAVWEYVMEYKEVMSFNDMVFTGWAGSIVGEVFYQMARAVRNKSNSIVARVFAGILDPASLMNGQFDQWANKKSNLVRKGDLDATQWSQMEFSVGVMSSKMNGHQSTTSTVGQFNGKVVNIPMYNEEGKARGLVLDTPNAEMQLMVGKDKFGISDWHFLGKTVLAAYYDKNLRKNTDGTKTGYEYFIGISSAFEWDQKNSTPLDFEHSKEANRDFIANAHVIGSTIEVNGFYKGLKVQFTMDVYADYAMVSSYALEEYLAAGGSKEDLLNVMRKRGYYYGSGFTTALQARASYQRAEVGVMYQDTNLSKSNLVKNRNEENVKNDADYEDQRSLAKVWISYSLTKSTTAKLSYEVIRRSGAMSGGFEKSTTDKRVMGYIQHVF